MKKAIIGLIISLISVYAITQRMNKGTEALTTAGGAPSILSTAQMDGAPAGGAPDLSKLPPDMKDAILKQAEANAQAMANNMNTVDNAGADPGRAIAVAPPPAAAPPAPPRSSAGEGTVKQFNYRDRNELQTTTFASGWTVVIERRLSDRRTSLADRVLTQLERQLDRAAGALPRNAVADLRKVPIWITMDSKDPQLVRYNWPEAAKKGEASGREGALEITRAEEFLDKAPHEPWMLLSKLAYAQHHPALGADNATVRGAYQKALGSGAYAAAKHVTGVTARAPALASEREYFAELTKAFYGKSDFYPFVREELREYDLTGYNMVEAAWTRR